MAEPGAGKQRQAGRQRQAERGVSHGRARGRRRQAGAQGRRSARTGKGTGGDAGRARAQGIAVAWGAHQRNWVQRIVNLSNPKPGHTTGGSERPGAWRAAGRGGAGQDGMPTGRFA